MSIILSHVKHFDLFLADMPFVANDYCPSSFEQHLNHADHIEEINRVKLLFIVIFQCLSVVFCSSRKKDISPASSSSPSSSPYANTSIV